MAAWPQDLHLQCLRLVSLVRYDLCTAQVLMQECKIQPEYFIEAHAESIPLRGRPLCGRHVPDGNSMTDHWLLPERQCSKYLNLPSPLLHTYTIAI